MECYLRRFLNTDSKFFFQLRLIILSHQTKEKIDFPEKYAINNMFKLKNNKLKIILLQKIKIIFVFTICFLVKHTNKQIIIEIGIK